MITGVEIEFPVHGKSLRPAEAENIIDEQLFEDLGLTYFRMHSSKFLVSLNHAGFMISTDVSPLNEDRSRHFKLELSSPVSTLSGLYDSWLMCSSLASLMSEYSPDFKATATGWYPMEPAWRKKPERYYLNAGMHIHMTPFKKSDDTTDSMLAILNFNSPVQDGEVTDRLSVRWDEYRSDGEEDVSSVYIDKSESHVEIRCLDTHFQPEIMKATIGFLSLLPGTFRRRGYHPKTFLEDICSEGITAKTCCKDGKTRTLSEVFLKLIDDEKARAQKVFGKRQANNYLTCLKNVAEEETFLPARKQLRHFKNWRDLVKTPVREGGIRLTPEDVKELSGERPEEVIKRYKPQTRLASGFGKNVEIISCMKGKLGVFNMREEFWRGRMKLYKDMYTKTTRLHPRNREKLFGKLKGLTVEDFEWQ
ncbi:MAG: hypothetical protein GOU97_03865 [Nanoarchaeota archaeon]|nr:hypothetical protein [Nanoarchaeota archaeon]